MCMIDDGERCAVHRSKVKKARKPHACNECGRQIAPGEEYETADYLYDGCWFHNDTCSHCLVACGWLMRNCHGYMHDGVLEDLGEHASEYRFVPGLSIGINRIVVGSRRQWKRFDGRGLMPVPKMPPAISIAEAA